MKIELNSFLRYPSSFSLSFVKLSTIIEKTETKDAKTSALNLLSFSQHSESKLRIKLLKRGFSKKAITKVIKYLRDNDYINDKDYAKNWLALRIKNRPGSKTSLFYGLLKQGIRKELADKIIREFFTHEIELECAEKVIKKLLKYNNLSEKELKQKLYSKGFKSDIIRKVLKGY